MIIELPYCTCHLYFYGFSEYKWEETMDPNSFLIFTDRPQMEIKVLNFQSDDGH